MTDAREPADQPKENARVEAADRVLDAELNEPDGPEVPLTDHAPGKDRTGPEQRGTGGSG